MINYNDVKSRQSHVTSASTSYSPRKGQEFGDEFSRQLPTDTTTGRCVPPDSSTSPRRSILKKPASVDSMSGQIQQLRRSSLSGAICRQQVLAEERALPVGGAERGRTANTKRVTFCV